MYMPEFKDKERIPNPIYFANVSRCVLQDNTFSDLSSFLGLKYN